MPTPDSEPEKYSIDDMMDRLRSRGEGGRSGEAELVVRADGTQAYRMRKRKRRSHQPKKEKEKRQRRFRVAQVVGAVALVAVTGLALLGSLIYLNSSAYRTSILTRIKTWTGAEPELSQFRVSPVSAAAGAVELSWPDSSMLKRLKLDGVRADLRISSIFGGAWKGAEMVATQGGSLILQTPSGAPAGPSPERIGSCPFQFRYRSPKFSVIMGDPERPAMHLKDSEVSLAVLDPGATTANLQFEGGTLSLAGWGEFGLNFASLQIEPGGLRLGGLRLAPAAGAKGEIEILNPRQVQLDLNKGEAEMDLRIARIPLSSLLGSGFGSWLGATVESPEQSMGSFLFVGGKIPRLSCRIPFQATPSSESTIDRLPLFSILAKETGEVWYQKPRLDQEFRGTVVRDADSTGLEGLELDARGRLSITGQVSADAAGTLSGVLEIGLPESELTDSAVSFRRVFARRSDGYAWASVKISGTGLKPADDFQQQMESASTTVSPTIEGAGFLEDEFRELTTPGPR